MTQQLMANSELAKPEMVSACKLAIFGLQGIARLQSESSEFTFLGQIKAPYTHLQQPGRQ